MGHPSTAQWDITIRRVGTVANSKNTVTLNREQIEEVTQVVKDEGGCLTDELLPLLAYVGAIPARTFEVYVRFDVEATSPEDAEEKADEVLSSIDGGDGAYVDDIVDSE